MKRLAAVVLAGCLVAFLAQPVSAGLATLKGTLSVGGSAPRTTLIFTTEDGARYQVRGPLTASLRGVGRGFVVQAVGLVGPKPELFVAPFEVVQYRIVEAVTAQGRRPAFVGRIAVDGEETYLVADDLTLYLLKGAQVDRLRKSAGARLCVVGDPSPSETKTATLTVEFFKILP